ncbi:hypothetical protein [Brazilian marseillevirus]|uniref:hypothetical protein n=1 Tax=Brazilian marseillevirus TaxID=1813599 RepID=UPI000785BA9A|nr:hypothetical protein A3303_gp056 [Brazilian marseillevirus]AMQ10564.1 hypothetical protein [Brazilian marseillevirus]
MEGTQGIGGISFSNGKFVIAGQEQQKNTLSEEEISLMEKNGELMFLDNERQYRDHVSVLNKQLNSPIHMPKSGELEFLLPRGYDMVNGLKVEGENVTRITFSTDKEKLFSFPLVQTDHTFVVNLPFAFPCFLSKFTQIRVSFEADSVSSVWCMGNFYVDMEQVKEMHIQHETCEGNGILFETGIVLTA